MYESALCIYVRDSESVGLMLSIRSSCMNVMLLMVMVRVVASIQSQPSSGVSTTGTAEFRRVSRECVANPAIRRANVEA